MRHTKIESEPHMTKQTAATAITNAKVHAHKASMRSSADLCIATAEECFTKGNFQYAFDWAVRSLGYSTTVFNAREIALFGRTLEVELPICHD